jgi:hypothetical protein
VALVADKCEEAEQGQQVAQVTSQQESWGGTNHQWGLIGVDWSKVGPAGDKFSGARGNTTGSRERYPKRCGYGPLR